MKKALTAIFAMALFAAGGAQLFAQAISAQEARELALSVVGGGSVIELELVADPGVGFVYNVVVVNNAMRYEMSINAVTGEIFRLVAGNVQPDSPPPVGAPGPAAPAPEAASAPASFLPPAAVAAAAALERGERISRNLFRRNVTRQQAVQIGLEFLASQGFAGATFRRHSGIDFEWGVWSWELYFNYFGREIELYIDMHTGAITNFEAEGLGRRW